MACTTPSTITAGELPERAIEGDATRRCEALASRIMEGPDAFHGNGLNRNN
jgi:hypothetical protein